ncbi:MAG: ribulose-phosphate 3-epimerase [Chloroflexi bacterium]|nr:MAG: ribulose-phosphate 3-epimerase [Phototrophicales bacterium]RMF78371.1 MAG: ribulose-phosphate 3-epimerase [Chloroflexota bacterium]
MHPVGCNGETYRKGKFVTHNIRIAPSILSADFARLGQQVQAAEQGGADLIHIDVMDGRFVPNITMGPLVVEAVRRSTALSLDVHLMIVEPDHLLKAFADAGANAIAVHVEACPHLHRTLQTIHALSCRAGVAINPHTPANVLSEIMHIVDVINVMTVNPGFGGQAFLPETLPKIRQIRAMIEETGRDIALEVDGGIDAQTAQQVVVAGANVLIAGSAIFNAKHSVAEGIKAIRRAVRK